MTWNELAKEITTLIEKYEGSGEKEPEGAWCEENTRRRSSHFFCSRCGGSAYYPQPTRNKYWQKHCPYKYCPNCGAKMKGNTK